jgi:DNA modification methylase
MPLQNNTIYRALGRNAVHPFPARMAPELVCALIKNSRRPIRVLDPMMGSGTVLALAQSRMHKAIGFDIDPLAVLMARVWTTPSDSALVRKRAATVLKRAEARFKIISVGAAYPVAADKETRKFIRYWFDAYARRQLTALSEAIAGIKDPHIKDVLWCAFSRLIIAKSAGASRALDLAHSRPHRHFITAPTKPFNNFLNSVELVVKNSLTKGSKSNGPRATAREGDARKLPLNSSTVDLVVTSPPYLNAIDYIRCSKFSLVWMGYNVSELSMVRKHSVGTEVGRKLLDDHEVAGILELLKIKKLAPRKRAIVSAYIDDMRAAIDEVARVLTPGGQAIYVIGDNTISGIYVKNSEILTSLAVNAGLKLLEGATRRLPPNRRYLPPPTGKGEESFDGRMRNEVVLRFGKPKLRLRRQNLLYARLSDASSKFNG